ncbi:MAG: hydrogenase expression/formation protein HypE [Lachnospiraceae bacterium]|nr:hydrogenase expression/formation protein HypE [Lachnospiraceae bacterium]
MQEVITLDYGSGGKKTSSLIDEIILPVLGNPALSQLGDGAVVDGGKSLVFSTDSFVVDPYFFPGGDIGKLSVCGTVNDVAMAGGRPRYLSLSLIIEEGLPADDLRRIIDSVGAAAKQAGVEVVTGDTKVVEHGKGDGIFINTSGIGTLVCPGLTPAAIRAGDKVLVSGTVGDHGTAVMLARDPMLAGGEIRSDCAPLNELAQKLYSLGSDLRVLRDPTRGGAATTLCEFAESAGLTIELDEGSIPVDPAVRGACDMLGLDPMYCANEGKLLAVVSSEKAQEALDILRCDELGEEASIIGEVTEAHGARVIMKTSFGGSRILTKLAGAQLPRIC